MKKKALVTGASGFIGSALVKQLIANDFEVNAASTHDPHLKEFEHPNLTYFEVNLLDKSSMEKAVQGCHYIFHIAGCTKVWTKEDSLYFDINVKGTLNLLDLAVEHNIERFVFTSSAGVFGPSNGSPITENFVRFTNFFNAYESSKAMAESFVKSYALKQGLNSIILSPTRVYGPSIIGHPATVNKLVNWYMHGKWRIIPGDGKKVGNYVYIEDVVNAHFNALTLGNNGETYIIGGVNVDYNTFFKLIREVTGIKRKMWHIPQSIQKMIAHLEMIKTWFGKSPVVTPKWIAKGKYNWEVDSSKAQRELKYEVTSLKSGMAKTANWLTKKNFE